MILMEEQFEIIDSSTMSTPPLDSSPDPSTPNQLNINQMDDNFASGAAQVLENLLDAVVESRATLSKKQDLALQLLVNLKHLGSIEDDTDIIRRGEGNDAIYLLLEGSAAVLSADNSVVLRLLESGDWFGEISALHGITPTANVRIMAGSSVFILPKTDALRIMKQHNLCSLSKLCIRRRYIPSGDIAESQLVLRDLCLDVLRDTMIFRAWDSEAAIALLGKLGSLPVTLCPTGADLIKSGDEGGELTVVIAGRINVIGDHGELCSIRAKEYPLIIGEEGFFNPVWESAVTFRTMSPCYVISIKKYHILQLTQDKHEAIASARAAWADIRTRWKELLKARHVKCHSKYRSQFQIEVIQNCLSQTEILQGFPAPCLHQMALAATGAVYSSEEAIQYTPTNEPRMVLILKGKSELTPGPKDNTSIASFASSTSTGGTSSPNPLSTFNRSLTFTKIRAMGDQEETYVFKPGAVFYPLKWMNKQFLILRASETTITVEIPWENVKEAVQMYSKTEIDLE